MIQPRAGGKMVHFGALSVRFGPDFMNMVQKCTT